MPNTEKLLYQTEKNTHRRCSIKKVVLKNFAIFTEKYLCWSLFFSSIKKKTPTQMFYCCEIFKKAYYEEHLCAVASELTLQTDCLEFCFWTVAFKTILAW